MEVSIIIVNHNTKKLTRQTIETVIDNTENIDYEIIVVDNSTDSSQKFEFFHEKVNILLDINNFGFGNACNIGARLAKGDFLLFLNSDTIIHENTIGKCIEYLKKENNIGSLGVRVILENGMLDHGCKRGFPTPQSALYYYLGLDKKYPESKKYGAYRQTFISEYETKEVDSVSGSFMIVPKTVFEELNGFDETFFMYGEDLDLCFRIKEKKYRIIYFADTYIIHLKGQSGLHTKSKFVIYHFYNAMLLFYKKHYKKKYNTMVTIAVYSGIKFKYFLTILKMKTRGIL